MSDNRRVKNANPMEYDGIQFKSQMEVMTYKVLVQEGFSPEYEKHTYLVFKGFIPTIPFFTRNTLKRKNKHCIPLSFHTMMVKKPVNGVTYTPDFYFEYKGKKIIVEVKGFQTEVFKHRFKLFRKYLEDQPDSDTYIVWEIFTRKQLLECINHLKKSCSQ